MTIIALNSEAFDPRDRVEAFQDTVAHICKLDFVPRDLENFRSRTEIGLTPTVITGHGAHSASTAIRTRSLAAETGDNVMVHVPLEGTYSMHQQGGDEFVLAPGMIYFDPNEVPGVVEFGGERTEAFYVSIPRSLLVTARARLDGVLRRVTPLTPQWRLFLNSARSLHHELPGLAPEEAALCATHVQDLAIMALGAGAEETEIARGRGLRAARLKAIKQDVEANLTSRHLTATAVAARHGISTRYLRDLFAGEETSFGDFVARRRLMLAYRMLGNPAYAGRAIVDIAMEAGYGDLSWFNASFKRTFGSTPGDVRARALEQCRRQAGST